MKKSSRTCALILALVMLAVLALTGCGSPAASTAPAASAAPAASTAPATSTAPAAAEATGTGYVPNQDDYTLIDVSKFDKEWNLDSEALGSFTMDLTTHDPSTSMKAIFLEEWCKLVREATNGGVDITVYVGGTLASPPEALTAVEMGTADLGWIIGSSFTDFLPITGMFYLPGIGLDKNTSTTEIMWDLYDKYPQFNAEYEDEGIKLLHMYSTGVTGISGTKEINTLDDLKGLKIRALGGCGVDIVGRLGASPITMGPGDMYDSLSKNVIDGYLIEWSGIKTFNLWEVSNYYNMDSLYTVPMMLIMNSDSYNELPDEYKQVIDYYSGREMSMQIAYQWETENNACVEELSEASQLCHFTDEDYAKIQEISREYNEERVAEISTADFDAQAFLDDIYAGVEQYKDYTYYRFG